MVPMKSLSTCLLLPFVLTGAASVHAATTMAGFSPGLIIPDNSSVGVADIQMISSNIMDIRRVELTLTIKGGFNGDYYVYLEHGGSHTVLMNRVGLTFTENLGYADSGASVIFASDALNGDIHLYQQQPAGHPGDGPLTGTWQPDGRDVNPLLALDSVPRTATLDVFNGKDASGLWSVFVADRSSGGIGTFVSWSLNITGETVPEPGSSLVVLLAAATLGFRRCRSADAFRK